MNINDILNGKGIDAMLKLHDEAQKKYGDELYSDCVKSYTSEKIVGDVETKDGKHHRMTIKW